MYSCYFRRPTGARNVQERRLFVRSEPINDIDDPLEFQTAALCSGILNLRRMGAGDVRYVAADYWANVNPIRFVRYQLPPRSSWNFEVSPLFMKHYDAGIEDEEAADGSDNWLPVDRSAWREYYQGNWTERLREYFTEIEQAMRGEMARRAEMSSLDLSGTLQFNPSNESWFLSKVETYWEFDSSSPPEFLSLVDAAMRSYCALPHVRNEFDGNGGGRRRPRRECERKGRNGVSFGMNVRPGIRAVMYAKTNRRFRMEVRHDFSKLRHGYLYSNGRPARREVRGVNRMVRELQHISEDAAGILNGFLEHLERVATNHPVPVSPSPTEFLFRVASLCESKDAAEVIVNLLLTERAVTRVEWLNNSINALRQGGVLERVMNAQGQQSATFAVTPAYLRAQEYLISVATPNDLTVRRRRRAAGNPPQA